MCSAADSITAGGDLLGVALGQLELDRVGVELARQQDLIDDPCEPGRLGLDHLEELRPVVVAQLDVVTPQRADGAVDGRERRAQLVRGGGDEVAARLLERVLLGHVLQRVDGAVAELDARDRHPALAAAEHDRDRDRPRGALPAARAASAR